MKVKFIALLATSLLLSNVAFAQSVGNNRAGKTQTTKVTTNQTLNPKSKGFYLMPDILFGGEYVPHAHYIYHLDHYGSGFVTHFNLIFGYELNNYIALGLGVGCNNYYFGRGDNHLNLTLPVYLNISGDFTQRALAKIITPYYNVRIGYNCNLKSAHEYFRYDVYYDYYEWQRYGFLFSPEIGVRIKNFYIGFNYMMTNSYYYREYISYNDRNHKWNIRKDERTGFTHSFALKLGYKFQFGRKKTGN